jgi:hypothetical protein
VNFGSDDNNRKSTLKDAFHNDNSQRDKIVEKDVVMAVCQIQPFYQNVGWKLFMFIPFKLHLFICLLPKKKVKCIISIGAEWFPLPNIVLKFCKKSLRIPKG